MPGLSTKLICLVGYWHVFHTFSLALSEIDAIVFAFFSNLLPGHLHDVTMPETCKCREQGSSLDNRITTWCCCQLVKFFHCQMLASAFLLLNAFDLGSNVNHKVTIDKSLLQGSLKDAEIR